MTEEAHDYIKNPDVKEFARKINLLISRTDKAIDKLSKLDNSDVRIIENRPANEQITDQVGSPLSVATTDPLRADLAAVDGSTLIGHHTDDGSVASVHDMFDHVTPNWLMDGGVITDDGGLDISWTKGHVYDHVHNSDMLAFSAGSDTLTDDNINYLYYDTSADSGALSISTSRPNHEDPLIGLIMCQAGDIWGIPNEDVFNSTIEETIEGLDAMFPTWIISGMLASHNATALAVDMSSGHLHKFVRWKFEPVSIDTTVTLFVRWFHTAGVWGNETNALVDAANYDNLTAKTAIPANKYVKHSIYFGANKLHFIYASAYYNTVAQAIAAPSPDIPPGLETMVSIVDIVVQEGDTALPSVDGDQWIDTRNTGLGGGTVAGAITSHLNLTDIGNNTHAQIDTHIAVGHLPLVGGTLTGAVHTEGASDVTSYYVKSNHVTYGDESFMAQIVSNNRVELQQRYNDNAGGLVRFYNKQVEIFRILLDDTVTFYKNLRSDAIILSGHHSNTDKIIILPNDIGTGQSYTDSHPYTYGNKASVALLDGQKHVIYKLIPKGFKATAVMIHGGTVNIAITVYEKDSYANTTWTSKGTGAPNTEIDITDISWTATNAVAILLDLSSSGANQEVKGGYITIEEV